MVKFKNINIPIFEIDYCDFYDSEVLKMSSVEGIINNDDKYRWVHRVISNESIATQEEIYNHDPKLSELLISCTDTDNRASTLLLLDMEQIDKEMSWYKALSIMRGLCLHPATAKEVLALARKEPSLFKWYSVAAGGTVFCHDEEMGFALIHDRARWDSDDPIKGTKEVLFWPHDIVQNRRVCFAAKR